VAGETESGGDKKERRSQVTSSAQKATTEMKSRTRGVVIHNECVP